MGREISVNRLDFLKDGTAVIRNGDYYICGRYDFTADLGSVFFNRDVTFITLEKTDDSFKQKHVHVKCEDNSFADRDFDLEYCSVDRSCIAEICKEHSEEDQANIEAAYEQLHDARIARQNCKNVEIFREFSDLINDLHKYLKEYFRQADYFYDCIQKVEDDICKVTYDNVVKSVILITFSE